MDDLCSTFIFLGLYVSVCMHYTEAQSACPTQPCPPGTFCFRGTSTLCIQCNPKCVECTGPGPDECIKCEIGFRLDKGSCIDSSTLPSVSAALQGQGCPDYECPEDNYCFHGTAVVCAPCHKWCSGCTGPGPDECKGCQSGYKKTAGLCTNSSIPTPVIYPPGIGCPDSPCSPLMFCFRGTRTLCIECNPACYGCTGPGPDECRQCNSGYAWNSGLCIFTGQTNQVSTTGLPTTGQTNQTSATGLANNSLPGSTNTTILATGLTNQVSTTGMPNNSLPGSTTTTTLATTLPVLDTTPRAFDIFNDLSSESHESFILVNWTINPNLVQFSWNTTISYQRIGIGDCLNVSESLFGPFGIDQMTTSYSIGNLEPWSRYRITLTTFGNGNITGLNSTRSMELTSAETVPRGLIDNFQVVTTSSTSVTFNWTDVLCEYRGGRLLWYEIDVTAVNTTAVLQRLFTNETYISVNGLAPSTHYMVSVRYVNTAGTGNTSVHYFQTSENATTTPPHDDTTIIQIETTLPTHDTTANAVGLFENFTYTNTNNSLLVTWSVNPSFFPISWNVTLTHQRIGIGDCQSVNESVFGPYAVGQNTTFSLSNPEPWSKYRFTLVALANGNVSSMNSTKSIEAVSAEIVPTGLIADFHVITKSSESATFNWTEVPCGRRGGTLLRYEVNVTSVNTTGVSQSLQTNDTYITVNGLAPSTFYAVSIRYVNNAGASNSTMLNFQTDENVTTTVSPVPTPLAPGTEVFGTSTTANNNNALQITWNIAPGLSIYSWNITISYQRIGIGDCERVNESPVGPILIGQGETSYSLSHPEVWSRYRFTLSARGIGVVSYITSTSSVEATSAEAAPVGVVSNLTTIRANTTSVTLGWSNVPCRQRGGQLTNFDVIVKTPNTTNVLKRLNSNVPSITISGLNATTYYAVSVRYVNLAGAGNFSPDYVFRTLDNVTMATTQPLQTSSTVLIVNITTELPKTLRTILPGQKLFQVSTPVNINGTIQVKWSINASFEHDPWNISLLYQRVGIGNCDNTTDNPVGPIYVRQNETSYSLPNVEPWSRYKITLTGSGNANLSNVVTSESIETVSSEVVPNGIIKDLHIINITSTSAMIGWTDLPCNHRGGVLLGYDVEVAPVNMTDDTQSMLTNATYVFVTALKPATFYTASVRYVNSAGPGNVSEYFQFQTMENVTSRTTFAAVTEAVFTNLTTTVQVSTPLTSGQDLFQNITAVNSNGTIEVKWSLDVTFAHFSWNISLVYQKIGIGDCDNGTDNPVSPIYVRHNETSCSLKNVEPWSRYKITLTGSGNANLSNVITSESIEIVSSEVVPNGIIKDLHIINTTSTSAMIGWTGLPCNHRGGVLLGYDVEVAPVNMTDDTQSLMTNATYVAVTALKPATFYTASVRYVNSAGPGNVSEYFQFQTMDNVTSTTTFAAVTETVFTNLTTTVQISTPLSSGQALFLNLTAVNSNVTIEVKWSLDVTFAHFSWNISLAYQKIGIGDCDNATDDPFGPFYIMQNETSYSIIPESWSRYKITLSGIGDANISNVVTSDSIEAVSLEVVPFGIIEDLHILNTTSTSATIGWTDLPCNLRGGLLLGYDVEVAPVNTTDNSQSLLTNASYVTIGTLKPATFYTVSVRYVNSAGSGNFSDYFLFQTLEKGSSSTTLTALTETLQTNLTTTTQEPTPLIEEIQVFSNVTFNNTETLLITWSMPESLRHLSWNITLSYQRIQIGDCENVTEEPAGPFPLSQNETSFSIQDASSWSRYRITLSADGNPDLTNVVRVMSLEAVSKEVVSSGVVSDLHVLNATSTSVVIVWSDVPCRQRGGSLLWYDVEISPVNATNASQILQTNVAYMDVTGLSPATFYAIHIRYVNNAGAGNFSESFQFQTSESETDIWEYMNDVPQNNSLEVTWSLSENYRHYSWNITLIYQRIGIGDCQNVTERQIGPLALSQNSSSYSIGNTTAWSKYRITLTAQRIDVISDFNSTKSIEVITSESAPVGVVGNVSIINVSSTSVSLGWTDLPCEWRGGSLLWYNVFVRPTSDISAHLNVTTNFTFITVSGLTPFTSYAASVRYVNGAGAGNFSDDVIFTTSEDVPGPVDINELEPDATSIIVHFNLSSPPNGKILTYNVSYSDTENFTTELLMVYNATSSEPLMVRNLSSNITYYVKMLACTSAGCGPYGNVLSVRTLEALVFENVSSKQTLKALPFESTYVTKNMSDISCIGLTWAAYSQSSPASSGYNVTVRNQNDNQTVGSSVALEPNATEYVRCGLNPGDNYSLSLVSYTRSLSGDVVDTVVYADQGGSQAPPAPILVNLTTTTATIRLVPIKHRTESTVVWQIKVYDVGSDGVDNETSNIAETFSVTNIPGYVTAELYPMTATGNDVFRIGDGQEYGGYKNTPLLPGHRYAVFFIVMSVNRNNLTKFSYARMTNSISTPTSEPSSRQSTTISTAIVHTNMNNKVDIAVLPNTATDMNWNHILELEPLSTSPTLIGIIVGVVLLVVIIVVIVIVTLYWRFRRNRLPKSGSDQYSKHKFETLHKRNATSLANHSGRSTINDQIYTLME